MFAGILLHEGRVVRDDVSVRLSQTEWHIFMALWNAKGAHIDRTTLNAEAYPAVLRGGAYTTWPYGSSKVILCKLRKKLVKVGLLIETTRIDKGKTYKSRAYKLVDVAAKPPVFPNAEAKTEEQAA